MGVELKSERLEFKGVDGELLVADAWGDPADPPVILSHGGGQTRGSWGGAAAELARQGWYAVAYDHRGHGESDWSAEGHYDMEHFAEDMACIARHFDRSPAIVGASMGGLSALIGAGKVAVGLYSAIVLVDVTPRMNQKGIIRLVDFMREHVEEGFASLDEAADAIALYTGRPRRTDLGGLTKNLRLRDGRYYWHWDPRFFIPSDDRSADLFERFEKVTAKIDIPVMLVRGRASDLVTEAEAKEFLELLPHAEYIDVDKAGHMVAGDRNDIFTDAVSGFLQKIHAQLVSAS